MHDYPMINSYLIVATPDGTEYPVLFPQAISHAAMLPAGAIPVSGGYFVIYGGVITILTVTSETLDILPRKADANLISNLLNFAKPISPSAPHQTN